MRLRVDMAVSVSKDSSRPDLNEDVWRLSDQASRVALADGASESFDSKRWAQVLVRKFVVDPRVDARWIEDVVQLYEYEVDYFGMSWSQQAAYERGSFSTLLGIELAPNGQEVDIVAVGDSTVFHVREGQLVQSFPYTSAEQFEQRPVLLATLSAKNATLLQSGFSASSSTCTWSVQSGDLLLLATDAVSQWLLAELSQTPSPVEQLAAAIDNETVFESLVAELRAQKRMKLDDSTFIRVVVEAE